MTARRWSRRAFLRHLGLLAGLGASGALAGCDSPAPTATTGASPVVLAAVSGPTMGPSPAPPLPEGLPAPVVPLGLGVHLTFGRLQANDVALVADAGFRFVRLDLPWSEVEREPGRYDFAAHDQLLRALAARGVRPLLVLAFGNPLYEDSPGPEHGGPHTAPVRQAFARFAGAAAAHFRGRGVLWEIWNEPNFPIFWNGQPNADEYMALVRATAPALRQADPGATLVAPALATLLPAALAYLARCCELGLLGLIDALSVHPYRADQPPETAGADYGEVRKLVARYAPPGKGDLPVLSGEWGYPVAWVSPERQAQFLVRQFLVNLLHGVPLSVWYDLRDDGPDSANPEHTYGLLGPANQPKPAYRAAQTLIRELSGYRLDRPLSLARPGDYGLLFQPGEQGAAQKVVAWTTEAPHEVMLPLPASPVMAKGMLGEPQPLPARAEVVTVGLSQSPLYLTLQA